MAFSSLHPFALNRGALPPVLGWLRLIAMTASAAVALQWILTMALRLALNAGRVYYSDETHSLWGEVLPFPVVSVPAWLTLTCVVVGCAAAGGYLALGAGRVRDDMPYTLVVTVLLCGAFPWAIAGFDADPSGVIFTPGPEGYPIGWHWAATPAVLLVIGGAVVGGVLGRGSRGTDVTSR